MSDPIESIERELANLQPHKPSVELRERIDRQIRATDYPSGPSSAAMWSVVITVGTLAACLFIAVLPRRHDDVPQPQPNAPLAAIPVFNESLPTFWTYHRAVTTHSASLDSLLDRHASTATAADDSLLHVHAFRRSQNQSAWGEL